MHNSNYQVANLTPEMIDKIKRFEQELSNGQNSVVLIAYEGSV